MSGHIIRLTLELVISITSVVLAYLWFGIKGAFIVFLVKWAAELAVKNGAK